MTTITKFLYVTLTASSLAFVPAARAEESPLLGKSQAPAAATASRHVCGDKCPCQKAPRSNDNSTAIKVEPAPEYPYASSGP